MNSATSARIKYIFCINCGRSGSQYLSRIFQHVQGCISYHEMKPIGFGRPMQSFLDGNEYEIEKIAREKKQRIDNEIGNDKTFSETNHCFIKGFGWKIVELIPHESIGIIILKRDREAIASSLYRVGASPLNRDGRKWIILPIRNNPLVKPPQRFISPFVTYVVFYLLKFPFRRNKLMDRCNIPRLKIPAFITNYELDCLRWYVDEIAAMTHVFKKKYPGISYYEIDLDDLNNTCTVEDMLLNFGLRSNAVVNELIGKPTNQR